MSTSLDAMIAQELESSAANDPLGLDRVVRLSVPIARLLEPGITPREAFVLSRALQGPFTVGELVALCDPPQEVVLEIIARALVRGFLA